VQAADSTLPAWFLEPTFGQRITGRLIDGLLAGFVGFGLAQVVGGLALRMIVAVLVVTFEVVFLVVTGGQTPGKRAVGTRVLNADGASIGVRQALVRSLVLACPLPWPPLSLLVVLPALKPPWHRGAHDWLAGTVVTSLPKADA